MLLYAWIYRNKWLAFFIALNDLKKLLSTVNSRYCGHSRDRNLVSVLARVRNSGMQEKKRQNVFAGFTVAENTPTDWMNSDSRRRDIKAGIQRKESIQKGKRDSKQRK